MIKSSGGKQRSRREDARAKDGGKALPTTNRQGKRQIRADRIQETANCTGLWVKQREEEGDSFLPTREMRAQHQRKRREGEKGWKGQRGATER